jgi:polar amino acid transport system substrate-binding protein
MQAGAWDVAFQRLIRRMPNQLYGSVYRNDGTSPRSGRICAAHHADVDRNGVRRRIGQELAGFEFERGLQHARLIRIPGANAAAELLITGNADVLAGVRQQLVAVAAKLPGSRVLDGRFMVIQQALATPKGRDAGARYLREFIEDIKASGLVAQTIEKNGIRGASVAPVN